MREDNERGAATNPGGGGGGGNQSQLDSLLGDAGELFSAADDEISRLMSTNSDEFNRQARQEGGE